MADTTHANDHSQFLKTLRQARRFLDKPVPQAIIDDLIEAGRGTGTAGADDSWQFIVVDDLVTKRALSEAGALSAFLASVSCAIVIVTGTAPHSKASAEGRATERIMLAASRHGLGSGTGWFSTGDEQEQARDILGVSRRRHVWAAVGVGYVDESMPDQLSSLQRVRQSLETLAAHESTRNDEDSPR